MKYISLIGLMRHANRTMRGITATVLIAFLSLTLQPLAAAANAPYAPAPAVETDEAKLARDLLKTEEKLDRAAAKLDAAEDISTEQAELMALRDEMAALDQQAMANFDEIGTQIAGLPEVIRNRHAAAVAEYQQDMATLMSNLDAIEVAPDADTRKLKVKAAKDHLNAKNKPPRQQYFDPNDLPNKSLKANPDNKPKLTEGDFIQAGLFNTPTVKLAALGDFTFDKLAGADNPAYLAATTEVVITPAIQAKAAELDHDPVKIYHWVRNNVEWQPAWGAVQDAELTLSAKRGNALDISSLLIALLRASGIPARYVHGTIEVKTAEFKNWMGGFSNAVAAGDFAAAGGIPVTDVTSGGVITKHRLEHIWVEAAIDFEPSRGAVNRDADKWVTMDPSYKQYDYLPGLDAVAISGLNAEQLANDFVASGTVNESESWVTGFDPTILQNAQQQTQAALEQYITDNLTDPTVSDVIGGRRTIVQEFPVLPSASPYRIIVTGARYASLPAALQQKMSIGFSRSYDGSINGVSFPWAQINNKKMTLSFRPATDADEQALRSLLPVGDITDVSQQPSSIPSYLVYVLPEIKLAGQVVLTGSAMRLGYDLTYYYNTSFPGRNVIRKQYALPAGSFVALANIAGNVSAQALSDLQARIEITKIKLESNDPSQISSLTSEDTLGDIFQAGTMGYYTQYNKLCYFSGLQQRAYHYLAGGVGSIGYEPNVDTFFGLPRAIKPGVVALNIPIINVIGVDSTDAAKKRDYLIKIGILSSALEHTVPEQLFDDADPNTIPPDALSAVKALSKARLQGQRIYHLTQANRNVTLANVHHDSETMGEIGSALTVGKEVITHASTIGVPGYYGAGYIILDPVTGEGAYKISGGANGGVLEIENNVAVAMGITTTSVISSYLGFSINYVASLAACYADEITAALVILVILLVIGAVVVLVGSGGSAGPAITALVLAMLAPQQASAAQSRDCRMDCSFASPAQLISAMIYDPEGFKTDYGAVPTSRYDICACRDGAIAIFGHGLCGQTNALWEVCEGVTWK